MRKKNYLILGLAAILVLSLFIAFKSGLFSSDEDTLYIAVAGPMSGKNKSYGEEMVRGINLYLDQVNKKGGVTGKKVKLVVFDDQSDRDLAKKRAWEIVKQNKALVVLGHAYSSTSVKGGEIYQEFGIPAISGSATADDVTEENDWYFRVIFNNRSEGASLANYVAKILKQDTVSIVYDDQDNYSISLVEAFEDTFKTLWGEVKYWWSFDAEAENLDEVFDEIVRDLVEAKKRKEDPGIIFLAAHASEATKLIVSMRRKGLRYPIIGGDALGDNIFGARFNEYPEEQARPGYFSDGIYAASQIIFDVAGAKAQRFRNEFMEKYDDEPGWVTASYYDAALVAVQAIKMAGVRGEQEKRAEERAQIRDYLATVDSPEEALEGVTGQIYFDEHGDVVKSVTMGVFENQNFISALTQLQPVPLLNINMETLEKELAEERMLRVGTKFMYRTRVVYTGIKVNEISDLNMKDLTYTLDFYLWFRYQGQFEADNIEFINAVEPTQLVTPTNEILVTPTNEIMKEQLTYRLYHVKGRFKADFLPNRRAFGQHVLGVSFRHRDLTRHNLIYVTDVLGMGLTRGESLLEKMKKAVGAQRAAPLLSPAYGWGINRIWFFQDIAEKSSLGNPEYLNIPEGAIELSQFNVGIQIKKSKFTLRRIVPREFASYLLGLSCVMVLLLAFAGKSRILRPFSRSAWFFQPIFGFLMLVSGEVVLIDSLVEKMEPYHLELIILIFDMLWWVIPAILLHLAAERFIWTPLEKRTGRTVPRVIRNFLAFTIYLLTFFGIIAYVFDHTVTGLLASTGMIAMIIGLAIQLNLSNVFSGIAINIEQPFRTGDWVKIGAFAEGKVVDITWRSTKIQARDRSILSIPNSTVSKSTIHNYSYPSDIHRLRFIVHVDPAHSPERVKKILCDAVLAAMGVLKEPSPRIRFKGLSDWSADYSVIFFTKDYGKRIALSETVWKRVWVHLDRAGIAPAIQRQEIHVFRGIKARGETEATKPLAVLQEIDTFQPFSYEAKSRLSKRMRRQYFPPDETIVQQGDSGDSLFAIIEGVVSVQVQLEDGEALEVARLGAGNFFGEMSLLTGEARTANVVSITDTYLYEITKEDIAPLIEEQLEVAELLSKILTERKIDTEAQRDIRRAQEIDRDTLSAQIFRKIQQYFEF